jgi:hypothetical protein
VILLASDLRAPRGSGDDALLRLVSESGADGVHVAGGCDLELHPRLATAALRLGLAVPSLALPLPERPLPAGRRLPRLAAHARDEREAAIALALRGLEVAGPAGPRFALLDFGEVALTTRAAEIDRAFARREMDEDEPGARLLAAALAERRARSDELTDACRWSLERLARAAERAALTLVLPVAATPWQAPSPREARQLADAFAGAPVGLAWDPGRLSVLASLGLAIADERLRALAGAAVLAVDNDAVGLQAGFLPGLAERDARVAAIAPGATVPHIVTGRPDATDTETAAAVALLRHAQGQAPAGG